MHYSAHLLSPGAYDKKIKDMGLTIIYATDQTIPSDNICRQSIKKLNFWNSEPESSSSTLAMVALCSGDFKLYSDASSITSCQLVIELDPLEWVCVLYLLMVLRSAKLSRGRSKINTLSWNHPMILSFIWNVEHHECPFINASFSDICFLQ